jgi:hypothetical protein
MTAWGKRQLTVLEIAESLSPEQRTGRNIAEAMRARGYTHYTPAMVRAALQNLRRLGLDAPKLKGASR